jgi:hypothetical protein
MTGPLDIIAATGRCLERVEALLFCDAGTGHRAHSTLEAATRRFEELWIAALHDPRALQLPSLSSHPVMFHSSHPQCSIVSVPAEFTLGTR